MSALVDYGSSDESEVDSVQDDEIESPHADKITSPITCNDVHSSTSEEKTKVNLFSSLPPPKTSATGFLLDVEVDKINTNNSALQKKEPVKITIPSLVEFQEEDKEEQEPAKKKLKQSLKGSGLFSLLPAPKNLSVKETKRPLLPHVLSKKPNSKPLTPSPVVPVTKSETVKSSKNPSSLINYEDSEEESDGEGDFFSLKTDDKTEVMKNFEVLDSDSPTEKQNDDDDDDLSTHDSLDTNKNDEFESNDEPLSFSSKFNPSPWSSGTNQSQVVHKQWQSGEEEKPSTSQSESSNSEDFISVQQDDLQLNEEALQRLCGRRAKRQQQDMQLIEVSGDAIMPDPKEWLTKQMTQEQETKIHSHSHRKNDGPTTQQRRKHQITYLAFQAKENELELKNQWSQNRMSRKQTQSKYGF